MTVFVFLRSLFLALPYFLFVQVSMADAQQTRVPISYHRQEHTLSCEIAALKMALGSQDIAVSEDTLIQDLVFDQTPKRPGVWGNPYTGFVGSIDGRMLITGYGVYADPIASVGNRYVHTTVIQNSSAATIAQHIANGDPVIIWGHYGPLRSFSWQTSTGTPVHAVDGEHARVVYGFDGPKTAPTMFYLMDPLYGQLAWPTQTLLNNWSSLDRMGVVVHDVRFVRVPGESQVWELSKDGLSRRWVTTWATLLQHAGTTPYIAPIDTKTLATYKVGPHIE